MPGAAISFGGVRDRAAVFDDDLGHVWLVAYAHVIPHRQRADSAPRPRPRTWRSSTHGVVSPNGSGGRTRAQTFAGSSGGCRAHGRANGQRPPCRRNRGSRSWRWRSCACSATRNGQPARARPAEASRRPPALGHRLRFFGHSTNPYPASLRDIRIPRLVIRTPRVDA